MPRKSRRVFPEGMSGSQDNLSQQAVSEAATKTLADTDQRIEIVFKYQDIIEDATKTLGFELSEAD